MTTDEPRRGLDRVYAAATSAELADAYSKWAADYDRETIGLGYCLPFAIAAWLARHVAKGDGPILDAGCGTGLSGPLLAALGYNELVGLDLSADMLAIAARRGVYREFVEAELGKPLPFPDGRFAAFVATGVFTVGHAPAQSLDELVRVTRPGGHAVFSVRDVLLEEAGFAARMDALARAGRWTRLEASPPYRAFAIDEPDVLNVSFVYRVH